jgi:hypothetical protein
VIAWLSNKDDWRIAFALVIGMTGFMVAQQSERFIGESFLQYLFWLGLALSALLIWHVIAHHGLLDLAIAEGLDMDWLMRKWKGTDFSPQDAHTLYVRSGGQCCTCGTSVIEGNPDTMAEFMKTGWLWFRRGHASHGWPKSRGGLGVLANARGYECHVCNIKRGNEIDNAAVQFILREGQAILAKPMERQ